MSTDVNAARATTSVLVADDHRTSDLLAMALEAEPDFTCAGTAATVAEALTMVDELRPDLVLMDVQLGDGDGIAATAELTRIHPELRVVVLAAHGDTALMQRAADANACCVLPRDGSLPDMLGKMRSLLRGGLLVHPATVQDQPMLNAPARGLGPHR